MLSLAADVWVLGNLTIDDVVRSDGTTAMGLCGGGAVYAALGARLWSDRVGLSARVGPDFPLEYLAALKTAGIDLRLISVAEPTLRNWALYESHERRRFVAHLDGGTHLGQSLVASEIPEAVTRARMCHVAPMPPRVQGEIVRALRNAGCQVALDPHDDYLVGQSPALLELLPLLTVFLPSRQEATLLYGRDAPEEAVRAFARAGARVVAIKLGGDGSLVGDGHTLHHVPGVPVRVIDPTGAGDAYCGAFAAVYAKSPDALEAARRATVAASFVVERQGATAILPLDPKLAEGRYLRLIGR